MKYIIGLIIQNSESKSITKQNSKHSHNTLYVAFMHGWLVQLQLQGAWFLEVAQHHYSYWNIIQP